MGVEDRGPVRGRGVLGVGRHGVASAAIDISDGLVADLGHICEASGVGAEIEAVRLPLSDPARAALADDPALLATFLGGGDDYELVFTAGAAETGRLVGMAAELELPITAIGRVTDGGGVVVRGEDEAPLDLASTGWRHF